MFTDEMVKDSPNPSKSNIDEYPDFTYDKGLILRDFTWKFKNIEKIEGVFSTMRKKRKWEEFLKRIGKHRVFFPQNRRKRFGNPLNSFLYYKELFSFEEKLRYDGHIAKLTVFEFFQYK